MKHEAAIAQQKPARKSQIPALVRFVMNRITSSTIQDAFRDTGLCPMDPTAVEDSLLVDPQDTPQLQVEATSIGPEPSEQILDLSMEVFDDSGNSLDIKTSSKEVQTEPIESLPCSVCYTNDVRLHPAVSSGVVSLDLASVLIPDKATSSLQENKPKRDNSKRKGRWLTSETEVQRLRDQRDAESKKEEMKKNREEQRKIRKLENEEKRKQQAEIRKQNNKAKRAQRQAIQNAEKGVTDESGQCIFCKKTPEQDELIPCILCARVYHKRCAKPRIDSFIVVCAECEIK